MQSYTVWLSNSSSQPKREKTVNFNKNGDVISIHRYPDNKTDIADTFINTYGPQNVPVAQQYLNVNYSYTYNTAGNITRREQSAADSKILLRHTDYVYDKNGRLTESRSQIEDEAAPYLVSKYEYNVQDSSIKETRYTEGKLFETTWYVFNDKGQLTRMQSEVNGGAGTTQYTFSYNEKGLLTNTTVMAPGKNAENRAYEYSFFE